eukprot:6451074-Heterocapsa_arctica.AAC.1
MKIGGVTGRERRREGERARFDYGYAEGYSALYAFRPLASRAAFAPRASPCASGRSSSEPRCTGSRALRSKAES